MSIRKYKAEQIVTVPRQVEVAVANGKSTPQACKEAGIHTQTYYRWRKEYGGLKVEQAKRMKELETQEEPIANVVDRVAEALGAGPHLDFNHAVVETDISEHGVKLTTKRNHESDHSADG